MTFKPVPAIAPQGPGIAEAILPKPPIAFPTSLDIPPPIAPPTIPPTAVEAPLSDPLLKRPFTLERKLLLLLLSNSRFGITFGITLLLFIISKDGNL